MWFFEGEFGDIGGLCHQLCPVNDRHGHNVEGVDPFFLVRISDLGKTYEAGHVFRYFADDLKMKHF